MPSDDQLLENREIVLGGVIDDRLAKVVVMKLLYLQNQHRQAPITLHIESPGGSVSAGFAILDTIDMITPPVRTCCHRLAGAMAAVIAAHGEKGHRLAATDSMLSRNTSQMKDGRTHLAYKAEHVVDLKTDLVLAAEIRPATAADTATMVDSVVQAQVNLEQAGSDTKIEEVAADKGYHAANTLELSEFVGFRTYIPESKRKDDRVWTDKPAEFQRAVYNNRRRVRRNKGKQLQRLRSEHCERTFAHICDSGGMRRSWLRGLANVTKRYLIATAAHNLGKILRKLFGVDKPKVLQGSGSVAELIQLAIRWSLTILTALLLWFAPQRLQCAATRLS